MFSKAKKEPHLRYTVFVLQSPAYLPAYHASERYGKAPAEFSITFLLVNLPPSGRYMALDGKWCRKLLATDRSCFVHLKPIQFYSVFNVQFLPAACKTGRMLPSGIIAYYCRIGKVSAKRFTPPKRTILSLSNVFKKLSKNNLCNLLVSFSDSISQKSGT